MLVSPMVLSTTGYPTLELRFLVKRILRGRAKGGIVQATEELEGFGSNVERRVGKEAELQRLGIAPSQPRSGIIDIADGEGTNCPLGPGLIEKRLEPNSLHHPSACQALGNRRRGIDHEGKVNDSADLQKLHLPRFQQPD